MDLMIVLQISDQIHDNPKPVLVDWKNETWLNK